LSACQLAYNSGYISTPLTFTGTGRSVFIVMQQSSALTSGTIYMFSGSFAGGNNVFDFRFTSASSTTAIIQDTYQGGSSAGSSSSFTQITGAPVVYSTIVNSSTITYYVNGTSLGSTTNISGWNSGTNIPQQINGYNAGPSISGPTVYCEVLVYNGTLGTTDVSNVTNYLRTKWGTA
jgi:hypothetical protein